MAGERERAFLGVEVEGLKEFQKELRQANPEMAKRLQQVNKRLVTAIAQKAQAAVYSRVDQVSPPGREGPARPRHGRFGLSATKGSIRGNASGREARIVAGGARAPAFFGFEFGGSRGLGGPRHRVLGIGFGTRKETRRTLAGSGMTGSAFRAQTSKRGEVRVRTRQFPIHRGREGYFLYPTVRKAMPSAYEDWSNLFDEVMGTMEGQG